MIRLLITAAAHLHPPHFHPSGVDLPWPLLSHPHSVRLPANIIIKSLYNLYDYLVVFKNSLSDEIFNYKLQPPT